MNYGPLRKLRIVYGRTGAGSSRVRYNSRRAMDNFKKRLAIDLGITLLLVIALLWGIFFFRGNINEYLQKITSTRNALATQTSKVYGEALLEGQYNSKAKNYLNVLHDAIPSYDELINLNQSLQALANQHKLTYAFSFAGETAATKDALGSVGFSLTLGSSDITTLLSFLKSMQTFKYLNTIDNVSLRGDGQSMSMTLKGRVYYR